MLQQLAQLLLVVILEHFSMKCLPPPAAVARPGIRWDQYGTRKIRNRPWVRLVRYLSNYWELRAHIQHGGQFALFNLFFVIFFGLEQFLLSVEQFRTNPLEFAWKSWIVYAKLSPLVVKPCHLLALYFSGRDNARNERFRASRYSNMCSFLSNSF